MLEGAFVVYATDDRVYVAYTTRRRDLLVNWIHAAPSVLAAFLASLVECVEALTVVLAVASVRGWRDAVRGSGTAVVLLLTIVVALGPALSHVPLDIIQSIVGLLLLLFGLRWLRKAILRGMGVIPLRDEGAAFAREAERLQALEARRGWDMVAFATSFQITMLEGIEVIFIVIAFGAGGRGLLLPAGIGALAAVLTVIALGLIVHRPLTNIPENTLKFAVGVLLSGLGTFWIGEGLGVGWPGGDGAIVMLSLAYLAVALLTLQFGRVLLKRAEAV